MREYCRKAYSRKSICRIVHRTPFQSREDGFCGPSSHPVGNYMLWWCIKIRGRE